MSTDYTVFYVEANAFCLIFFAIMLIRSLSGVDRQEKQRFFDGMLICHVLYFVFDSLWALAISDLIMKSEASLSFIYVMICVAMSSQSFLWFVYVELYMDREYIKILKKRILLGLPVIISVAAVTLMFIFARHLVLAPDLMPTDLYYRLLVLVPIFYIVAACSRAFAGAFRKENYARRGELIVFSVYPLFVTVFGVLQTVWRTLPLFCFGCALVTFYIYTIATEEKISIDPLTKLNNRAQLRRYISVENEACYVIMLDLNGFKGINDRFGHVEGDRAIVRAADCFRAALASDTKRSFAARYGGDEFIILFRTKKESDVLELKNRINKEFARASSGEDYELSASFGYAEYSGDTSDFQSAVAAADEMLYEDKKARKASAEASAGK